MIYNHMITYKKSNIYPFHMPGHKRIPHSIFEGVHPFEIDYTEVDGLDDLHEPEEMFRESMDRAKAFYGTNESYYLVNGSTSGIMAAISAVCSHGDQIIVGRNCHKSVYMAIELLGLDPVYVYPQTNKDTGIVTHIELQKIKECVDNYPDAKAIMLVSPTYEGNVMDIKAIKEIAGEIPVIVDEAHGAHFPFWGEEFPQSALSQGADIVIQSLHKTMPALTQTALLHVCSDKVPLNKMKECLNYFQTTSPSYLFSASIDYAISYGIKHQKEFDAYGQWMKNFRKKLNEKLKFIELVEVDDPGKLVISTAKCTMTGQEIYDILLKDYRLQMEMVQEEYALAMTSICDSDESFDRLSEALVLIDQQVEGKEDQYLISGFPQNEIVAIPYDAKRWEAKSIALEKSEGETSVEYVYLYPPGIPLIVPGERISKACIEKIQEYHDKKLKIKGFEGYKEGIIKVRK